MPLDIDKMITYAIRKQRAIFRKAGIDSEPTYLSRTFTFIPVMYVEETDEPLKPPTNITRGYVCQVHTGRTGSRFLIQLCVAATSGIPTARDRQPLQLISLEKSGGEKDDRIWLGMYIQGEWTSIFPGILLFD